MNEEAQATARRTAAAIGRFGVWSGALADLPADQARGAAAEIERLGYGALWIGEVPAFREVLTHAGLLLAATERIVVATGIANLWLRDPAAMRAAASTLAEAYPDRFVLGVGASHSVALELVGRDYGKPLTETRRYLAAMQAVPYLGPAPANPVPVVLAALRPRMQELARDSTAGMHSFFVTPQHTAEARNVLGPDALLVPEQAVYVEQNVDKARAKARKHVQSRLGLTHYVNHVRAMGFTEEDLADGGSDHLVDSLVAWGGVETVAARLREHLDAGADQVAVHALGSRTDPAALDQLRMIAERVL